MDIALCVLNSKTNILQFAGAYNPLWVVRKSEKEQIKIANLNKSRDLGTLEQNGFTLNEIKASKMPIGKFQRDQTPFTYYEIQLQKGDMVYTFTDGFQDQFGGEKDDKYMSKNMKKLLLSISEKTCDEQHHILDNEFENWIERGESEQIDDVCIVGVKI